MSLLQQRFDTEMIKKLQQELDIKNVMDVPRLTKIVVNMGVKDVLVDKKNLEKAASAMAQITGQKPGITKAKKSIATFKLRKDEKIGLVVTLRGKRMYDFFEKLTNIVLPRLRDFRGIRKGSFDGKGNYTIGFSEQTVFPEIDPSKVDNIQGLEITMVTTAKDNNEGIVLLTVLGIPFQKS